ncbi:hypothetical protein [Mitsuaria sp. GD03876]|uniref:hypothetical protein n=1 Tax=Mitsuaria sp. GD03876 TaxID=2975399 RepID=UPI0024495D3D|nr:hypothetical protein [Mitsuaria sp. GD03876]MDH0866470.1 hypothetical protein [Mitsuaria sp. GD03876]
MPELQIAINEADRDVLERVRLQQGLDTLEQAAEWLIKSRLRRSVRSITGRGRALYVVPRGAPK